MSPLDESRQMAGGRRGHFPSIFAKLRRHPRQPERRVDLGLGRSGNAHIVIRSKDAVFVELQPKAHGSIAQGDVVRLRACEVLERGAVALWWDEAQVGLKAVQEEDAALGVALRQD